MKAIIKEGESKVKVKVGRIIIDPDRMISAIQLNQREPLINSITEEESRKFNEFLHMVEKRNPDLEFEDLDISKAKEDPKKEIIPDMVPISFIRLINLFGVLLNVILGIAIFAKVY